VRYGIPFPCLGRASFGVLGANIAAVLRAFVPAEVRNSTWIWREAINTLIATLYPAGTSPARSRDLLMEFWLINLAVIRGYRVHSVPPGHQRAVLLGVGVLLLVWPIVRPADFGPMVSGILALGSYSDFLKFLIPGFERNGWFWASLAEYSPISPRSRVRQHARMACDYRQALALPTTMTLYSLIGILVTSADRGHLGTAIWDPVQLLRRCSFARGRGFISAGKFCRNSKREYRPQRVSPAIEFF